MHVMTLSELGFFTFSSNYNFHDGNECSLSLYRSELHPHLLLLFDLAMTYNFLRLNLEKSPDKMEKWKRNLTFLIIGLAFHAYFVEGSGHRQKYGETCSRNKKCDFTKWLRCGKGGRCVCYQGDPTKPNADKVELYYDSVAERCVGRSGTDCSQKFYPFDDEDPQHFHLRGSTTNHWRYGNGSLRCGANAFCDYNGKGHTCNCRKSYYETEDGKCSKLKSHGENCTSEKECDPDGYLRCDSTCICEKADHTFDLSQNKCIIATGLKCEIRINRLDKRELDDCAKGASCDPEAGVCRCKKGTQIHSDRSCKRGWGQECDPIENPCGDSKLSCRSKVCQCKYPLHMIYDEPSGQCMSIASGPCGFNDTSELAIQCAVNAECVMSGAHAECRCKKGYLQTIEGECVKGHDSHCELDGDCDEVGPLACINGHCGCQDELLQYEQRGRKCRGLVGSRCRMNEDSCIEHSSCIKFEDVNGGTVGRCSCNRGFKETGNRTCSK